MKLKNVIIATTNIDLENERFTLGALEDMVMATKVPFLLEFALNTKIGEVDRLWIEDEVLYANLEIHITPQTEPIKGCYIVPCFVSEDKTVDKTGLVTYSKVTLFGVGLTNEPSDPNLLSIGFENIA